MGCLEGGRKTARKPRFYWCAHEKRLSNVSAKKHAFCDNCDNCDKDFLCSVFPASSLLISSHIHLLYISNVYTLLY